MKICLLNLSSFKERTNSQLSKQALFFLLLREVCKELILGFLMNLLFLPYGFFKHSYCYFTYLLLLYLIPYTLPKNFPLNFPYQLNCTLLLPYIFLPPSAIFTSVLRLPKDLRFSISLLRSLVPCCAPL